MSPLGRVHSSTLVGPPAWAGSATGHPVAARAAISSECDDEPKDFIVTS